jgi:hypothetical protein
LTHDVERGFTIASGKNVIASALKSTHQHIPIDFVIFDQ